MCYGSLMSTAVLGSPVSAIQCASLRQQNPDPRRSYLNPRTLTISRQLVLVFTSAPGSYGREGVSWRFD